MKLVPEEIFDQHIIVLGKTRSGKSSVMRLLVEHLLDQKKPVCIVDPKGDWWGLKSSADGKDNGYPIVIFGGEHGDVPLNSRSGAAVAELTATENRPALIDLGGWMPGERTTFWIDFASTFFRLTRGKRWLVIDEAHNFCPKGKIMDPNAGKMLHWSNRLASEGLGKGIALLAASQRPQKVHNDFLTSCETLFAMRVVHKADRTAYEDWIEGCGDPEKGPEVVKTLAALKRGEAWVWSPESEFGPKQIQFPMFSTYDSFKPQAASQPAKLKGWAEVDLSEVTKKLEDVVKEAKENDPAELKKQIRELRLELKKVPTGTKNVPLEQDQKITQRAIDRAVGIARKDFDCYAAEVKHTHETTIRSLGAIAEVIQQNIDRLKKLQEPKIMISQVPSFEAKPQPEKQETRPLSSEQPENGSGKLRDGAERMLATLAQWYPSGMTIGQVRAQAGLKKSGTSATYLSNLRSRQLIEERDGLLFATQEGLDYCQHVPAAPQTTAEVLAVWNPKLRDGARRMLQVLVELGGETITKEELMERAGLTKSGTSGTYLSNLRTAHLITVKGDRVGANTQTLFL